MPKEMTKREYYQWRKGFHIGWEAAIFDKPCEPENDESLAAIIAENPEYDAIAIKGYRDGHFSMSTDDSWEAWMIKEQRRKAIEKERNGRCQ